MAGILTFEMGYTPQENTAHGKKTSGLTITAFLYNSKKEGAYLDSYLDNTFSNIGQTLMAVKPFTWEADTAMIDAELVNTGNVDSEGAAIMANPVINGVEVPAGSKYIEVPAVVFNVFNAVTGVAYGDINYIEGGKTLIVFEDWNDEMFGGEKTFVVYGFVLGNGNPITVLESSTLTKP